MIVEDVREPRGSGEVNIGLIGCGSVVEGLHLPALMSIPDVKIKWVCDSLAERARRVARNWGVQCAFSQVSDCSDVDAVLIATPVGARRGILEKTSERGWHALCEKPFARNTMEHLEMLEWARRGGLIFVAGYMRRFYWAVEHARKMLQANVLGPLIEVVASESANLESTGLDQSSYRNNAKTSGGGVLMETGCHLIDEIMFVSDAQSAGVRECEQKLWKDYEVETVASGYLTLRSGDQVGLQLAVSGVRPVFQGIAFRCEYGEIRLRVDPTKSLEVYLGQAERHHLEIPHPRLAEKHVLTVMAFRSEWEYFLEAVKAGGNLDLKQETGLATTDVITKCGELTRNCSLPVKQ